MSGTLARATVTVDLVKIAENARRIVHALPHVHIVGVTKVTCGSPEVAFAMLAGGVSAIGESRLENAQRLRDAGVNAAIWLLRAPTPDTAEDAVRLTDVALISEMACARALDAAAVALAPTDYAAMAMVDLGDLREGMMPEEVPGFLDAVYRLPHLKLLGIGTNLTCFGAIVPDEGNLGQLASLAYDAERRLDRRLVVSGGSSTSLEMAVAGRIPGAIDNLRVGEAIVLGVDPATREPIPGLDLHRDAVTLAAPVIECKVKPSLPIGTSAQDAFGNIPHFEDLGPRRRAICAIGRQDAPPHGLQPVDPRVRVLGASSDHLVLDVDELDTAPGIGEPLYFTPGYGATLAAFTSPYVTKRFEGEERLREG